VMITLPSTFRSTFISFIVRSAYASTSSMFVLAAQPRDVLGHAVLGRALGAPA
jgi:hypothetical protein